MKQGLYFFGIGIATLLIAGCGEDHTQTTAPNVVEKPNQPLNYHALVIGIEDYQKSGWPSLNTAKADADAVGLVLLEQFGFDVVKMTDADASRGNIIRQFDQYMKLTDQDALLIYFAGHGIYDEKMDEGYWIPHGAKRERLNMPAKEDWLSTTRISKYMDAIPARHVLVIADSCYGGSLFRGDDTAEKEMYWYKRAINAPSRYLITSGNLEPVLDSGIRHSIFAQEVLNFLQYSDAEVFAASDIGHAIRHKVSKLTGQLPRMGSLLSSADAGGEFVFVRKEAEWTPESASENISGNTAMTRSAADHTVRKLTDRINTYSETLRDKFIRPRILACLGPTGRTQQETEWLRSRMHHALDRIGGCIFVERNIFTPLFNEVQLGSSRQADQRAATEIGKLLPASLIMFGQVIETGDRSEIHIRIVESETSRVLVSTYASYASSDQLDKTCQKLATTVMQEINRLRPLMIPVQPLENDHLTANWGRFHGARKGDLFEIVTIDNPGLVSEQEVSLGTAELVQLNEEQSEFNAQWSTGKRGKEISLWLKKVL